MLWEIDEMLQKHRNWRVLLAEELNTIPCLAIFEMAIIYVSADISNLAEKRIK